MNCLNRKKLHQTFETQLWSPWSIHETRLQSTRRISRNAIPIMVAAVNGYCLGRLISPSCSLSLQHLISSAIVVEWTILNSPSIHPSIAIKGQGTCVLNSVCHLVKNSLDPRSPVMRVCFDWLHARYFRELVFGVVCRIPTHTNKRIGCLDERRGEAVRPNQRRVLPVECLRKFLHLIAVVNLEATWSF